MNALATLLNQYCPSGVGKEGTVTLNRPDLERLMREGCALGVRKWLCQRI